MERCGFMYSGVHKSGIQNTILNQEQILDLKINKKLCALKKYLSLNVSKKE